MSCACGPCSVGPESRDPMILFDCYNMGLAIQDLVVFPSIVNSFFLLGFANQQGTVIFFPFTPGEGGAYPTNA